MDRHIMGTLCNYEVGSEFRNCGNCRLSTLFKMMSKDIGEDVYMCELFSPIFAIYVSAKMVCDSWRDQEEIENENYYFCKKA